MSRLEVLPDGTANLDITGAWIGADRSVIAEGRADGVILNYARGFSGPLPDFTGLPVRRLTILDRSVTSLESVYALAPSLEKLSVQTDASAVIELDRLPKLKELIAHWAQIRASVRYLGHLESLFVLSYDEVDLEPWRTTPTCPVSPSKTAPAYAVSMGCKSFRG